MAGRTYTIAADNDRSRVRLLVGDRKWSGAVWTDDEIESALAMGGNVNAAAALMLRASSAMAAVAGDAGKSTVLLALADSYELSLPTATVSLPALLPMDDGFDEDNP